MNPAAPRRAVFSRPSSVVGATRRITSSPFVVTARSTSGSAPAGRSVRITPAAPAARASLANRSTPYASTGFRYVMMMTGTWTAPARIRSSTRGTVMPCSRAVWVVRWTVGPSASGSENGTPISMKSAPAAATARRASRETAGVGKPAVRYGMSARDVPSARHREAMGALSDKVVADVDTVFDRVGDLDDGARVVAAGILLGKIDDGARIQQRPIGCRDEAYDRAVDVRDIGVGAVHQRHLIGVKNDAGAHRVDPDQVDERFHHDRIVPAPRVLPHLLEHLVGLDRHGLVDAPAGGRVKPVGDRDDLRVDRQGAAADRLGVPRQVDLHMVFVRGDHPAVGDLAVAAQPE